MRSGGRWRPIGAVLVDSGAIDEAQLEAALAEQKTSGRRLGEILIDSGAITWNALAHAIAAQVEALDEDDAPDPTPIAVVPDDRMQTLETMLRERQRAFLELVSTTERLRRNVAKLQDELAEKNAEIARLRAASL